MITVAALSFHEPNRYCNDELHFRAADGGFTLQERGCEDDGMISAEDFFM